MRNRVWVLMAVVMGFLAWDCYPFAVKDTTPKMTKEELRPLMADQMS